MEVGDWPLPALDRRSCCSISRERTSSRSKLGIGWRLAAHMAGAIRRWARGPLLQAGWAVACFARAAPCGPLGAGLRDGSPRNVLHRHETELQRGCAAGLALVLVVAVVARRGDSSLGLADVVVESLSLRRRFPLGLPSGGADVIGRRPTESATTPTAAAADPTALVALRGGRTAWDCRFQGCSGG